MSLRHRIQEWAADRISWVQYPHIRAVGVKPLFKPGFAHRMPLGKRLDLALISLFGLCASALLLFALAFVAYSVLFG